MQILTRLNKVIAHSEYGYTPVGNTAICAVTSECYDNVLITTVDCVPTDIDCYDYYYINGKFIKGDTKSVLREIHNNDKLQFWVGTQAQYDAIPTEALVDNCVYIITDDSTMDDFSNGNFVPLRASTLIGEDKSFSITSGQNKDVSGLLQNGKTYVFDVKLESGGTVRGHRTFVLKIPKDFDNGGIYSTASFGFGDLFIMYISVTANTYDGTKLLSLDGKSLSGSNLTFDGYAEFRYREINIEI